MLQWILSACAAAVLQSSSLVKTDFSIRVANINQGLKSMLVMNIGLWRDANKDGGLSVCCVTFVTGNECHNKLLRATRDTGWWQKPARPLIGPCLASLASYWLGSVLWHLTWHHQMPSETGGHEKEELRGLSVGLVTQIRKCPVTGQCVGPHTPHTLLGSHLLLIRSHGDA